MAKLLIYHLFATVLVLIHSRRRKREKNKKKKKKAFLDATFICSEAVVRRCSVKRSVL